MADRIVKVAAPPVSTVTISSLITELEQLRMEMSRLQNLVKSSFPLTPVLCPAQPLGPTAHLVLLPVIHPLTLLCAGTISDMVTVPRNADLLVLYRQTTRPAPSGDDCCWPTPQSLMLS